MRIRCFEDFDALPPRHADFLDRSGRDNFFLGRAWAEHLREHHLSDFSTMVVFTAEDDDGTPRVLMPAVDIPNSHVWRAPRILASATHSENFGPLCILRDPADGDERGLLTRFFRALRRGGHAPGGGNYDVVRLCPLPRGSDGEALVQGALRRAGFLVQPYLNSYNSYETTAGLSHANYFAARSSNMRYNTRRRRRNLEKAGQVDYRILTDEADLDGAIGDYIQVTVASWKDPTSMISEHTADLMRRAARAGVMRLGLLYLDGLALAAQFWIVAGGVGHCVRLAYREDHRKMSPGVVLTDHMIRHILDRDHAAEISYGFGDDEYKEKWMRERRYFDGLAAFNPFSPLGLVHGAVQITGHGVKSRVKKALGRSEEDAVSVPGRTRRPSPAEAQPQP